MRSKSRRRRWPRAIARPVVAIRSPRVTTINQGDRDSDTADGRRAHLPYRGAAERRAAGVPSAASPGITAVVRGAVGYLRIGTNWQLWDANLAMASTLSSFVQGASQEPGFVRTVAVRSRKWERPTAVAGGPARATPHRPAVTTGRARYCSTLKASMPPRCPTRVVLVLTSDSQVD
jgi:hypothetical protein